MSRCAVAGWGVLLTFEKFCELITPYLSSDARPYEGEDYDAAFDRFLDAHEPGLSEKVVAYFSVADHVPDREVFATTLDCVHGDVDGTYGIGVGIPTRPTQDYGKLLAACEGHTTLRGLILFLLQED